MSKLLEEFFTNILKRKNKVNLVKKENIVNHIVKKLNVIKWGSLKKHLVDLTKTVINKLSTELIRHFIRGYFNGVWKRLVL